MTRPVTAQVGRIAMALLVLGTLRTSANPVVAQPPAAATLHAAWEKSYGKEGLTTEFRAMSAAKNDDVFIGASERDSLDAGAASASRLVLWRINAAGEIARETEIKQSATSKGTNTATIRDVLALENREALVLVDFEGGHPSIVRVDANGKQTTTRELARLDRAWTLFKIVPGARGTFLLVGHESLNALIVSIDAAGNVQWEKTYDRGRMEYFVDGVASGESGFALVGNSGQYDALRTGPSIVWVGLYDAAGAMKSDVTFPGRYGKVARSPDGGYVVVYDRSNVNTQEIRLKGLGADLKELWDTQLLVTGPNFSDFQIAALARGGFAVAGGQEGRPWLTVVDAAGRPAATLQTTPAERSLDLGTYGLGSNGGASLFVASSHIEARTRSDVRQRVLVRKVPT